MMIECVRVMIISNDFAVIPAKIWMIFALLPLILVS